MKRRFAVAALFVAILSCSDNAPNAPGTMSFTYVIGGVTLTFTATGDFAPSSTGNQPFAVGGMQASPSEGSMAIAFRPVNDSSTDLIVVASERITAGNSAITEANCDTLSCTGVVALFADGDICALSSGNVNLTEVTPARLKGTFSGAGACMDFSAEDSTTFSVSNGTFDVAIVEGLFSGGEIRAGGGLRKLETTARLRRRLLPLRP